MPILLALGSSVAYGLADFFGGLLSRRGSFMVIALLGQTAGLVLSLVIALLGDRPSALAWLGITAALPAIWLVSRSRRGVGSGSPTGISDALLASLFIALQYTALAQVLQWGAPQRDTRPSVVSPTCRVSDVFGGTFSRRLGAAHRSSSPAVSSSKNHRRLQDDIREAGAVVSDSACYRPVVLRGVGSAGSQVSGVRKLRGVNRTFSSPKLRMTVVPVGLPLWNTVLSLLPRHGGVLSVVGRAWW